MVDKPQSLLIIAALDDSAHPFGQMWHVLKIDRLGQTSVDPLLDRPINTFLSRVHDQKMAHLRERRKVDGDVGGYLKREKVRAFGRCQPQALKSMLTVNDAKRPDLFYVERDRVRPALLPIPSAPR